MKKILIPLVLLIIVGACKKEGSGGDSSKLLLSKVFFNDLLQREYIYSIEGRLVRVNNYFIGNGQSTLSTFGIYEYNHDGTIKYEMHYNDAHSATVKRVYTYNEIGKVLRIDEASIFTGDDDLDNMDYYYVYDYNSKGQLIWVFLREANVTLRYYEKYNYDEKGNVVDKKLFYYDNVEVTTKQKTEIVPGTKQIPEHWRKQLIEPTDFGLYEMFIDSRKYTSYWLSPAVVTDYTYKNRVYNDKGYLISQVSHSASKGVTNENEYTYEYVQQ